MYYVDPQPYANETTRPRVPVLFGKVAFSLIVPVVGSI